MQQRLSSRESELIAERDKLQAEVISLLRAEKDKLQQRLSSPSSTAEMRGSGSARRTDSPIDREARRSARRQSVALVRPITGSLSAWHNLFHYKPEKRW